MRKSQIIDQIRAVGARVKLIPDGDVAAALNTAFDQTGVDILLGVGGSPEGVLSAAALKRLGGSCKDVWSPVRRSRRNDAGTWGFNSLP